MYTEDQLKTLLEEAKTKYPIGTRFRVVHIPEIICTVESHDYFDKTFLYNAKDDIQHINFLVEKRDDGTTSASVWAGGKWAEIYEEVDNSLLESARTLYPAGTKFRTASEDSNTEGVVEDDEMYWFVSPKYRKGEAISTFKTNGLVYCKGKWADVIYEFTPPKPLDNVEIDFVVKPMEYAPKKLVDMINIGHSVEPEKDSATRELESFEKIHSIIMENYGKPNSYIGNLKYEDYPNLIKPESKINPDLISQVYMLILEKAKSLKRYRIYTIEEYAGLVEDDGKFLKILDELFKPEKVMVAFPKTKTYHYVSAEDYALLIENGITVEELDFKRFHEYLVKTACHVFGISPDML